MFFIFVILVSGQHAALDQTQSFRAQLSLPSSSTRNRAAKKTVLLQEGFVPRSFSAISAVTVNPAHSQWVPFLLVCVMACCLMFIMDGSLSVVNIAPEAMQKPVRFSSTASFPRVVSPEGRFALSLFARPLFSEKVAASAAAATLNGRVTYEGTPKKLRPIDMSAEPNCAKFYSTPPMPEVSLTGSDNSLQNVIVYISAGAPEENFTGPVVHLNQRGCRYTPHIVAVLANQEVWVQNDDTVTHSVHPMAHTNTEWNRSQPPGTPPVVIRYGQPEFIRVKCELHPWMRGVLAVFRNSHHAITDSTGAFTLADLPSGKYTVTAWHEVYGSQSKELTIAPGQSPELNFVFKVTPY